MNLTIIKAYATLSHDQSFPTYNPDSLYTIHISPISSYENQVNHTPALHIIPYNTPWVAVYNSVLEDGVRKIHLTSTQNSTILLLFSFYSSIFKCSFHPTLTLLPIYSFKSPMTITRYSFPITSTSHAISN